MSFDPWRRLLALEDVVLRWSHHHLPPGALGTYDHARRLVTLHPHQSQAQRRCTLTHELVHLERGPVDPPYVDREERAVDREAALRLIPFDQLAEALQWAGDEHELAEQLWVDVSTVLTRLAALTPGESAELVRRLDDAELRHP